MLPKNRQRFIGAQEIGRLFGISRQRVYQLVTRPDFPEPWERLAGGAIWNAQEVRQWAAERGRAIHD